MHHSHWYNGNRIPGKPQIRLGPKRQRQQTMHIPPIASSTVKTHVARHPRPSCSPQHRLQPRSVEPSTIPSRLIEEDGDDVIYLGTFPRQPYHHTAISTFRCPVIDSNRTLHISPRCNSRKKKDRRAGQSPTTDDTAQGSQTITPTDDTHSNNEPERLTRSGKTRLARCMVSSIARADSVAG